MLPNCRVHLAGKNMTHSAAGRVPNIVRCRDITAKSRQIKMRDQILYFCLEGLKREFFGEFPAAFGGGG